MKKVITMSDVEYQEIKQNWPHFIAIILFPVPIILMVFAGFITGFMNIIIIFTAILSINSFRIRNKFLRKHTRWVGKKRLYFEIGIFYFLFIIAIIEAIMVTADTYIDGVSILIILFSIVFGLLIGFTSSRVVESFRNEYNRRSNIL